MKTIPKESVDFIIGEYEKLDALNTEATVALNAAKEGSKDRTITRDGVEISEADAWREVYELGGMCASGKALEVIYPQVFEVSRRHTDLKNSIEEYCIKEFGVNPYRMSFGDFLRIIRAVMPQ